jgi:hypothetical protein
MLLDGVFGALLILIKIIRHPVKHGKWDQQPIVSIALRGVSLDYCFQ